MNSQEAEKLAAAKSHDELLAMLVHLADWPTEALDAVKAELSKRGVVYSTPPPVIPRQMPPPIPPPGTVQGPPRAAPLRNQPAPRPRRGGMPVWAIVLIAFVPIFFISVMAGLLLPALAKAKQKAQRINCAGNLKQVGLAFRIWEGDHNDGFPFNVSTNQGGTRELSVTGADGFDQNSWLHFQVMSNELGNPKVLLCPIDTGKQVAPDFSHLTGGNCTYLVRAGTNVSDATPQMVLAICPLHHNVLFVDGSVQQLSESSMQKLLAEVKK